MRHFLLPFLYLIFQFPAAGQTGGQSVFSFLNTSSSARVSALGGALIASPEGDVSLALENPGQIHETADGQLSFQHQFVPAGIQSGYFGYGKHFESKKITTQAGVKYLLYGSFDETDEFGNLTGTFKGSDLAIHAGISYLLYDKLRLGGNLKFIQSSLDVYRSTGLALDLGALYQDTASGFSVALVIKQAGIQLTTYDEVRESMPIDVQLGLSKKLKYLPFRFYVTLHHLNRWNLLYDDPNNEENGFFGGFQPLENEPTQVDNFFRHLIFGGEMTLGKNELVKLRVGYNHQMKQELKVTNIRSLTGITFGFGLKVKKFQLDYAVAKLHFGGSSHHLGIATNLRYFTGSGIL